MDIISDAIGAVTTQLSHLWPKPEASPQLINGKLSPCPLTPNCVSSECSDWIHHVDPLPLKGSAEQARVQLKKVINELGGTVQSEQPDYIWSTFIVPLFGFIDDVEFRFYPAGGVIHVRSSARFGISDLGVNRGRVEQLRKALTRG
jgi:uncharacterized protein (DUF1499 family)